MAQLDMKILTFILAVISCTVHAFQQIIPDYTLMHYTRVISEEHFSAGRPVGVVLPLAVNDSSWEEVEYLIHELHTSGRWPILVYNVSSDMKENMYSETNKQDAYIILISGPCEERMEYISRFRQQVYELSADEITGQSFNPRVKFIVSVMSNCEQKENTEFSRAILNELWLNEVMKATVLFRKFSERGSINDSVKNTYLEMHTLYHHEKAQGCNGNEGTLPVKVHTAQNFSDIKRSGIFQNYYNKNFHKCQIRVHALTTSPFVNHPKRFSNNHSRYQEKYEGGWEIELLGVVEKALNMSLDIEIRNEKKQFESSPDIFVGAINALPLAKLNKMEVTRNYLTNSFVWYTPCAVQNKMWSRFFNIFSVGLWVCFAFSLVLAVLTVRCISSYEEALDLHESKSYCNNSSATTNTISVALSVSVKTQPRATPLRLFFFCWVCYSVAISTVFQAYFTAYLIEPGYEEPIRTVEQMIQSEKKIGFDKDYEKMFEETSESVDSAILKNAVRCPDFEKCLKWATEYQNFSIILSDLQAEKLREFGKWFDENNRPLLCKLENGFVKTNGFVFLVRKGRRLLELINDVIVRVVEGGIFTHIKNWAFYEHRTESKFNSSSSADSYTPITIRHLRTPFYLFFMGNALALVFFMIETLWNRYTSKGRGTNCTSLCHRHA